MFSLTAVRLVLVVLLLGSGVAPVAAQETTPTPMPTGNGTGSTGSGGGGGGGVFSIFHGFTEWFDSVADALQNPMAFFQEEAEKLVDLLVDRPVATRGGEVALTSQPDGGVMRAVWDINWTMAVPIAGFVTILYVGLTAGMRGLMPPSILPNHKANAELWKALGKLVHVAMGWTIMIAWVALCLFISKWAAPTGEEMFPNGQALNEAVVAGGLGGVLLWLSSGVLAILVVLVFGLSWAGTLLGPPAYTVLVGLEAPDLPIVRKLDRFPDEGIIVAMAACPVPTALILGGGYPVINALRASTDGAIATLLGAQLTTILTLVMWILALVAPLLMVWQARGARPAAAFTAGLLGAASAVSARDKLQGLDLPDVGPGSEGATPPSGAGAAVDPLDGSPFSRSTDGGFGGALGGDTPTDNALGAGGGAASGASGGAGGMGGAPAPSADGGGSVDSRSATGTTSAGSSPTDARALGAGDTTSSSPTNEIPSSQEYEVGYERPDGGWQPVRDNTYSRDWLTDGAYDRISHAFDDETLHLRGVQDGETYDIREEI